MKIVPKKLAQKIASIASDHKADRIVVLDLGKLTSFTDYFVICSGNSDRHVSAIAHAIHDGLKAKGKTPLGTEGLDSGLWALLDYGEVVTHVFQESERNYYQLEKLWYDAPRVKFREK